MLNLVEKVIVIKFVLGIIGSYLSCGISIGCCMFGVSCYVDVLIGIIWLKLLLILMCLIVLIGVSGMGCFFGLC